MKFDRYLKLFFEKSTAGLAITNSIGEILDSNKKFIKIFGNIKNIREILNKRQQTIIKDAFEKKYTFSLSLSKNIHKENEKQISLNLKHLEKDVFFFEAITRDAREEYFYKETEEIKNLKRINKIRIEIVQLIDKMLLERKNPKEFLSELTDKIYNYKFFTFLEIIYKEIKITRGIKSSLKVKSLSKDFKNSKMVINYSREKNIPTDYKNFMYSLLGYFEMYYDFYEDFQKVKLYENHKLDNEKFSLAGQMMIGMLHEINNPLSVALLNTELFLYKNKNNINNKNIDSIKEALEKIKQIMEIFRGSLKKEINLTNFSLKKMIESAVYFLRNKFDNHIKIIVQVPNSTEITGDYNKLTLVMINLISNAIDSIQEKNIINGFIEIKSIEQKNQISLSVSDNGKGIEPEKLNKIFNPFFTTKTKSGLGYGLFFVSSVCNNHNIRISVSSKINIGTTFTLAIPKKQEDIK